MAKIEQIKKIIFEDALKLTNKDLVQEGDLSSSLIDGKRKVRIRINKEEVVVFCYPTTINTNTKQVHIQPNQNCAKNERIAIWNECCKKQSKFFFLTAFKDTNKIYDDYIVSIEALKQTESIPNTITFADKEYEQILRNNSNNFIRVKIGKHKNIYLSFVKKNYLKEYLMYFDNRPYMYSDTMNKENIIMKPTKLIKIEENKNTIEFNKNRLLFGAPGTGKSYELEENRKQLCEKLLYIGEDGEVNKEKIDKIANILNIEDGDIRYESLKSVKCISDFIRVTFHQEYSYGEFVGSYKPTPKEDGEGITYKFIPGPFSKILVDALNNPEKNYLLIIEEINRANAAAVFGDIFQLLDRNSEGYSEYSINPSEEMQSYFKENLKIDNINNLFIPSNLYIWATMNSADQGVFPMDSAFKRRWSFEYMPIDGKPDDSEIHNMIIYLKLNEGSNFEKCSWNVFRKALNEKLKVLDIEEDRLIGPRFLSKSDLINQERCKQATVNKLFSYLRQDVLRYNYNELFKENLTNMADIRTVFYEENKSIKDILQIEFNDSFLRELRLESTQIPKEANSNLKSDGEEQNEG